MQSYLDVDAGVTIASGAVPASSRRSAGSRSELKRQEFVVLVGPSGCGKTTLLHAIGGLTPVTKGKIHLSDRPVTGRVRTE